MKCDSVVESLPLYYYGELPLEEEERLEDHLHGCEACREQMERFRRVAAALDRREAAPPPALLAECRHDLMRAVYHQPARRGFVENLLGVFAALGRLRQPLAAMALLALGFFAARLTTGPQRMAGLPTSDVVYTNIRSVQPEPAGAVRIVLDETRRRTVNGRLDDGNIRRLLLAAMGEEDNPAVRVESVGILKDYPLTSDVRTALLNVAVNDPNAGVRLKAVEGLKTFAAEPEVRAVLGRVLLDDENPGVRIQAIDLLVAQPDDAMVGILQNVVQKENNGYVRMKCERALKEMNASIGTF